MQLGLTQPVPARASAPSVSGELGALVRLALPLAAANLGQVLIGAVDTAVVGRLGETELGAAGLGNSLYFVVTVIGMGVMLGLDPLVSQAVGASEPREALRMLWQGVWLALLAGVPLCAAITGLGFLLERVGIQPASAVATRTYLVARLPGLVPFLVFVACRSYLQAVGVTRPVVVSVVLANIINLPASWALVFGFPPLHVPALGIAGAAWASSVCTVVQMGVLVMSVRRESAGTAGATWQPHRASMQKALSIGIPIGFTMVAEFGVFSLVNVLMGNIDARALAGHQVAITLASATFMVPVGVGAAASVRVGKAIGRGDQAGTRLAGLVGLAAGTSFMLLSALAFLFFPRELAAVISDKADVIAAAVPLLSVAAVFQLSDGAQAVAAGALRGAGDTRFPLIANLAGHYLVGLPIGDPAGLPPRFRCGRTVVGPQRGPDGRGDRAVLAFRARFVAAHRARVSVRATPLRRSKSLVATRAGASRATIGIRGPDRTIRPRAADAIGGRVPSLRSSIDLSTPRLTPHLVREALAAPSPFPPPEIRGEPRAAAVVVPIRFEPEPLALVVFRSTELRDHPGEVAFPGGKLEDDDDDLQAAALRELEEELDVRRDQLELLGALSPIPVVTGRFLIHPFVAELGAAAAPRIASTEIERVVEMPLLPWLTGARRHGAVATRWRGQPFLLPHFEVEDRVLYGASACIFFELVVKIAGALGIELLEPEVTTELPWAGRY